MTSRSRILLLLYSLGVCTVPLYAEEPGYVTEQADENTWTVTQGKLDGRLAWVRIQNGIDQTTRDDNPHHLVIRWEYADDGDDGMPPIELKDRFHALEDALDGAIREDGTGLLSLVLTTAGSRQWHVHFADAQAMQDSVDHAFAELPDMPISLTAELDPDWSDYSFFISALTD